MSNNIDYHTNVPVALVVFNRLNCVKENIDAIRIATPTKLYVISDGPRESVPDDFDKVRAVREYIEENVDWDCELIKIYAESNMGCDPRSISGYNEVFKKEDMAILLEDDCIPSPSFFKFCETMLNHYKDCDEVMMITGMNRNPQPTNDKDYYFCVNTAKWGWATWKRAWDKMYEYKENGFKYSKKYLRQFFSKGVRYFYEPLLIHAKMQDDLAWDALWDCCMIANKGLSIVSKYNMVRYIGVGDDATHGGGDCEVAHIDTIDFEDDIAIRDDIPYPDTDYDLKHQTKMLNGTWGFLMRARIAYIMYCVSPNLYRVIRERFF